MTVRINIHRIQHVNTFGFTSRIHTTLSTVKAMVMAHQATRDLDREMMESTHEMSISIMLSFLSESGMLRGGAEKLCAVRTRILSRPRHEKVSDKLGSVMSIGGVLRHITCMAICGEMYAETPASTKHMCCATMHHGPSPELQDVNWRSWSSLEQCIRLGEVIRLSFVLEENFKTRRLLSDDCMVGIIREVVDGTHAVVNTMPCADSATVLRAGLPRSNDKEGLEAQTSFSKTASRVMIEIIIAGIMAMDTPSKNSSAYAVLFANLCELHSEQRTQWNSTYTRSGNVCAVQPKTNKHASEQYHTNTQSQQNIEPNVIGKARPVQRTKYAHARPMPYEQIRCMVTNASGFVSSIDESTSYSEEMQIKMQKTMNLLCPEMKLKSLSTTILQLQTNTNGIHLLRPRSYFPYGQDGSAFSLQKVPVSVDLAEPATSADVYACRHNILHKSRTQPVSDKIPSTLYYVLRHAHYVLSADVSANDARYELITALRREMVLAYLDIIYSVWAAV